MCSGVADFGGGVGVEAMRGGVRALSLGAGDAGALRLSTSRASPSGRLMRIAALFRGGREKAELAAGEAFGCGVGPCEIDGVIDGVEGVPPMLEAGR
jgi:hypothetical protein